METDTLEACSDARMAFPVEKSRQQQNVERRECVHTWRVVEASQGAPWSCNNDKSV